MGAFIKTLPDYWRYLIQIVFLSFFLTTMPSSAQAANGTVATVPPVSSWITWCGNYCESPIYSSAAEACSYYNSPGRTYTVSNVTYSELGMDYPGSFRCLVTTSLGTAYSGWVMPKGNWSCPANSTGTTTCTCNTNYVPDATGTSCVHCTPPAVFDTATGQCGPPPPPPCTAIDAIPPLPKDDACAQSLNDGKGVDIRHKCPEITEDMKKGVECLAKKIAAFYPPITYSGPSATIRNKAYQKHLSDVYNQSEEIAGTDWTDAEKQACAARIADVDKEMKWHKIKAGPSKKGDQAPHVKGEAIDISEDVANALIERCTKTNVKAYVTTYFPGCIKCQHIPLVTGNVEDYINSAVINPPACNLEWGGLFKNNYDPIHFQLPQKK